MPSGDAKVYFCPRFHVNFYHSYRGDTPDEKGFGKVVRIIRSILDSLDSLSEEGIEVKCAWDFDNAFTLGSILPHYVPDIIERVRTRVQAGIDEVELMSWNNGLLTAHTPLELERALAWAIFTPDGSGVLQTFGSFVPIARSQECMFTSSHIDTYRKVGIEAVSLYYSAVPFNAFGSFVPRLPAVKRYNPLTLKNPATGTSMRLMPAINQGDLAEYHLSAARMLTAIRREQFSDQHAGRCASTNSNEGAEEPSDLLVILDLDADDTFWAGMAPALSRRFVPSFGGLSTLIEHRAPAFRGF